MNFIGTQIINTPRLVLRRLKLSDAQAVFSWAGDEDNTQYMSFVAHKDITETQKFLRSVKYGDRTFHWGIILEGKLIGTIGANILNPYTAETGYILHRGYWGQGYTAEALKAVIHYLIADVGFNRVCAGHHPDNPNSGRVMQKAGMVYEGVARGFYRFKNKEFADTPILATTAEDLFGRPKIVLPEALPQGHPLLGGGDGELSYILTSAQSEPDGGLSYDYNLTVDGTKVGHLRLTLGNGQELYYLGHIGYTVEELYRGHGYAERAVRMIMSAAAGAGLNKLIITCNPDNYASIKTIERLGGELIRTADVPKTHYMYKSGERVKRIYVVQL